VNSPRYRVHSHSLLSRASRRTHSTLRAFHVRHTAIQGGDGLGGGCDEIPAWFYVWRFLYRQPCVPGRLSAHHSDHGLSLPDVEPLGHNRRVALPGAEAAESDYCALLPSPHIKRCQDAVDCGKMGEMSATLENIRVNLPSPEKYRITYWSCSGSRRAISSPHLSTK
jgi:hypothetical protein